MHESSSGRVMDWREGRRLRAWELHEDGWKQCAIAAALGVTPGAVSQWFKRARLAGPAALRRHPAPGPAPKLTTKQRAGLPALLARGAEAFGWRGNVWTAPRVAVLIQDTFGVRYHPAHLSRVLRAIGWSPQKPRRRASQRNAAEIAAWFAERWPALKKGRSERGARSSGPTSRASICYQRSSAATPHAGTRPPCAS